MANPSPAAVQAIRTMVATLNGQWSNADDQILASLNNPNLANPAPRPAVPRPFTLSDLMGPKGPLDRPTRLNLKRHPILPRLVDAAVAQDRATCHALIDLLVGGEDLTADQATALAGAIDATQPDPAWPAQVSWAVSTLGRPVDADDLAAARPRP